jgi:hypothetical protein
MKKVKVSLFLVLFSITLVYCNKESIETEIYKISVYNGYFEQIDSVKLNLIDLGSLDINSYSTPILLKKGLFPITYITESGLFYSANVDSKGIHENLVINIDNNGLISINNDER